MSDDLARQLRRDEGVVEHAYIDSEGWTTIGVGRLIDKRKGGRLRDDEIEFLLQNDITEKTEELMRRAPWVADLDDARQGVLINMAFNLGVSGLLGFRKTLALIESGDYAKASERKGSGTYSFRRGRAAAGLV